jgi:hypothetical protein
MDLLTLCFFCLITTVIIFVIAMIFGQKRMRQVEGVMRQVAERHGGEFTPGNLVFNPYITLSEGIQVQDTAPGRLLRREGHPPRNDPAGKEHRAGIEHPAGIEQETGTEHRLELRMIAALGGRDDPSHTEVVVKLPPDLVQVIHELGGEEHRLGGEEHRLGGEEHRRSNPHFQLRPHSFRTRLTITLGVQPFLTGDKAFDAAFDLRGAPATLLRRLITPAVRSCVLELSANHPAACLARQRRLLPSRAESGGSYQLRWKKPTLIFSFYTAGLPTEPADWEPRLQAAKLLLHSFFDRYQVNP